MPGARDVKIVGERGKWGWEGREIDHWRGGGVEG